jgi:hypothetical protein
MRRRNIYSSVIAVELAANCAHRRVMKSAQHVMFTSRSNRNRRDRRQWNNIAMPMTLQCIQLAATGVSGSTSQAIQYDGSWSSSIIATEDRCCGVD